MRRTCVVPTTRWRDAAIIPTDKELYQRQIEATGAEIDALVYDLHGLTEEQIAFVERRDD